MKSPKEKDTEVRNGSLLGREAYEASVRALPTYDDGTTRKRWEELPDFAKWSWERPKRPLTEFKGET